MQSETRGRLLDAGQFRKRHAHLLDWADHKLAPNEMKLTGGPLRRAQPLHAGSPLDRWVRPRIDERLRSTLVLWGKALPVPFRYNFDGSVDHFDGRLVVDRVCRAADARRPSFRRGHGVLR
jgi:hypothetical protein